MPVSLLYSDCTQNGAHVSDSTDTFNSELVGALNLAVVQTVPAYKENFFKFWWDEEC